MIFVAGSANLDFVVRASHIPAPGETVLGRAFQTFPGGKGANQAIACARAGGAPTHMLLALGDDAFAQPLEASLADAGVVSHVVRTADTPTGTAFICVSDDAENAITVAPGANLALQAKHLPPLAGFSHLLLQLETPLDSVTAYAQAAQAQGVQVVLNAAPAQLLPPALLATVDVLVVNEGELASVAQHQGSVAECLERLAVPCVVVTLGHRGCCARLNGQILLQAAFPVTPVDTTAAGDSFCGALTAALAQGHSLALAMQYGSAAGAMACTRPGAQSSIPTHAEVQALVQSGTPAGADAELRAFCGFPA
ncbi:ribokinase [Rhodoferax sp. OV413]|uniref:ribokinase n=1 Tax=Rhodoferax sp. OV413 TaxID=1855285 RepID=UPI000889A389|nr:ribokinase [Rhodoferax sp. OV413]SDP26761.1 ribokinase [Rhodoferax sp. OV413]